MTPLESTSESSEKLVTTDHVLNEVCNHCTGRNQLGCPYDVTVLRDGNYAISDYEHECLKVIILTLPYTIELLINI